jgi:hypothetical protein
MGRWRLMRLGDVYAYALRKRGRKEDGDRDLSAC